MWRFVQVSDPHLASHRDGKWNNRFICSMMPEVMACLKNDLHALHPEFILATGDICSHQSRAAMFEARDIMDDIGIPYYPMGGNHDFVKKNSRVWFLEAFKAHLPAPSTYYAFEHRGLLFCVLDPWWKWSDGTLHEISQADVAAELDLTLENARWALPESQLAWLETILSENTDKPTIIASHYPAVPTPERMQRPGYRDSGALDNGEALLALLSGFPQVRAIFSGHMHMHYIEAVNGITQIVTSALPEYPVEYREVQVFEDRLEVSTRALSDDQFSKRSLIKGKEWTSGTPLDRETVIPLV